MPVPVVFEPDGPGCETDPEAPGVPVGTPVTAVELPPGAEVEAVDCPIPVLPWDPPGGVDFDSL